MRRRAALVRHVLHLRAGHAHVELGRHVQRAARAARGVDRLVRVRLDPRGQLRHRLRRHRGMHREEQRHDVRVDDRLEILHRVVGQVLVEVLVGRMARGDDHAACSRRAGSWRRNRCRGCSPRRACSPPPPAGRASAVSFSASVRAMRSMAPPGVAGTTIFTGRAGYVCAAACAVNSASKKASSVRVIGRGPCAPRPTVAGRRPYSAHSSATRFTSAAFDGASFSLLEAHVVLEAGAAVAAELERPAC